MRLAHRAMAPRPRFAYPWSMVALRKLPPSAPMTVAAFLAWDSGDRSGRLWQVRDGVPETVGPYGTLPPDSIGLALPLQAFYRTTTLA